MRLRLPARWSKAIIFGLLACLLLLVIGIWLYHSPGDRTLFRNVSSKAKKSDVSTPSFNITQFSINDPTSPWVVVNKGRILPSDYVPADLVTPSVPLRLIAGASEMKVRASAASAMEKMFAAATQQNIRLMLASGYRSYNEQNVIYSGYVRTQGQVQADAQSAKPGHSEHQSGWAADIEPASRLCEVSQCFGATPEGKWLVANAHSFGFIIRYQLDQENLSGYEYEPWHIRYVGVELADQIVKSGDTLEQFFGLGAVTQYPPVSFQLNVGT